MKNSFFPGNQSENVRSGMSLGTFTQAVSRVLNKVIFFHFPILCCFTISRFQRDIGSSKVMSMYVKEEQIADLLSSVNAKSLSKINKYSKLTTTPIQYRVLFYECKPSAVLTVHHPSTVYLQREDDNTICCCSCAAD